MRRIISSGSVTRSVTKLTERQPRFAKDGGSIPARSFDFFLRVREFIYKEYIKHDGGKTA